MARKRLTPPPEAFDVAGPLETKAMPFGPASRAVTPVERIVPPAGGRYAPISRIAGDSAAAAALETLAGEMAAARAAGRLVEALPLALVDATHLVRDRVGFDEEEFRALVESLRLHGQRAPIEVIDLGAGRPAGRYGLISGWRRLSALRQLQEETREARFSTVLALLRQPQTAGEAYVAMVEENELRVGLSYYERARIAARAVEAGAFADRGSALRTLYATASRAKRSKIGSFLAIHDALSEVLHFPAAIPERLGLALATRLGEEGAAEALRAELARTSPPVAADELALLAAFVERPVSHAKQEDAGASRAEQEEEVAPGIRMRRGRGRVVLSGSGVDWDFVARLEAWLRGEENPAEAAPSWPVPQTTSPAERIRPSGKT